MSANRRARRRAGQHPRPGAGAIGTYEGVPVYDGLAVDVATFVDEHDEIADARVVVGIGPVDGVPVAYVTLCPCEGVPGLLRDVVEASEVAKPLHPTHHERLP
jgi:hypothetical protein